MSRTTAVMLQDKLNDIERNAYDGIDFRQELNEAYALADELETENAKLRVERDEWRRVAVSKQDSIDHMRDANAENAKLRKENDTLCRRIDELCMEVESLRRTARRIVVSDGGVGHAECGACGSAIDQDDAWCRHCGAEFKGDA